MQKTYTFTITLDELEARRATEVLTEAGLTPEGVIHLLLERTAREGAIPLKKSRATKKRRTEAACPGLFTQGDLFAAFEEPQATPLEEEPAAPVDTTLHPSLPTIASLKKSRATKKRRTEAACPGLFTQGDLFAAFEEPQATPLEEEPAAPVDTTLHPSLSTIASLQEAQAKLRWRARERESAEGQALFGLADHPLELLETKQFRLDKSTIIGQEAQAKLRWRARERESAEGQALFGLADHPLELLETKQFRLDKSTIIGDPRRPKLRWRARERESAEGQALFGLADHPLELLETKQFRLDKSTIIGDPRRPAIISALEKLFTEITTRQSPSGLHPIEKGGSVYVPIAIEGDPLGLIYEVGEGEICLVRYGAPQALLLNPDVL